MADEDGGVAAHGGQSRGFVVAQVALVAAAGEGGLGALDAVGVALAAAAGVEDIDAALRQLRRIPLAAAVLGNGAEGHWELHLGTPVPHEVLVGCAGHLEMEVGAVPALVLGIAGQVQRDVQAAAVVFVAVTGEEGLQSLGIAFTTLVVALMLVALEVALVLVVLATKADVDSGA